VDAIIALASRSAILVEVVIWVEWKGGTAPKRGVNQGRGQLPDPPRETETRVLVMPRTGCDAVPTGIRINAGFTGRSRQP
jgi:hypothetical protein